MSQQPIPDQDGVQALVFGASGVVRQVPLYDSACVAAPAPPFRTDNAIPS